MDDSENGTCRLVDDSDIAENIKSQAGQVTKDLLFNFRKMHVHHSDSMDDTSHPMES